MRNCFHKNFSRPANIWSTNYTTRTPNSPQTRRLVTWERFTFTLCLLSLSTLLIIELNGLWFRTLRRPARGMMWQSQRLENNTNCVTGFFPKNFLFSSLSGDCHLCQLSLAQKIALTLNFKISWLTNARLFLLLESWPGLGSSPNERLVCFQVAAECFRFEPEMFLRKSFVLCLCREPGVQHKRTWRIIKMYNLRLYVIHFSPMSQEPSCPMASAAAAKRWNSLSLRQAIDSESQMLRFLVVLELEFRHLATALGDGACALPTASRIYLPLYSQQEQREIISVAVAMYSLTCFSIFRIKQLSSRPGLHLPIPQPIPNANLSISIKNLARTPPHAGKHKQLSFFLHKISSLCAKSLRTQTRETLNLKL